VRTGVFFDIPEKPNDMALLWERGRALATATMPDWLDGESASDYREVVARQAAPGPKSDGSDYVLELEALADLGLVVDDRAVESGAQRVYVAAPRPQDVWSIGLYSGRSPGDLAPCPAVRNPVLCRNDVTDVSATFVADPFMVCDDDRWSMFFEVMNWRSGKGEIGLATSSDGLCWAYQRIVLSEPFHLSYPYVFQWRGTYFMIPESFQAGAVRLYEATAFPTEWTFRATLVEAPYLADASLIHHDGRWWMWVDASPSAGHDTLKLFHSDELLSGWQEHPQSPIVTGDPRNARPAGRIVDWDGRLVRFAQNCEPAYGTDIRAFKITSLTGNAYAERPLGTAPILGPGGEDWNRAGMHHVDLHRIAPDRWIACVDGWHLEGAS
jgi:hypothetical protein